VVLSWPELQLSKYEAGVNVPMACAAGGVLAEKWKPSLAEVLSLGLGPGPGDGMD